MQMIKDPVRSEDAFNEFYCRYKSFVLKVCRNCCRNFDSSDLLADDIFQNTFLKILNKAHTFKLKNPDENTNISSSIKAWLSRIAKNELINFLRKNPDEKILSDKFRLKSESFEDLVENNELNSQEERTPSIQKHALDKALGVLSYKERYILMTYMEHLNPLYPNQHLPDETLEALSKKFSLTSDNIRQIKGRALKKLKQTIENNSK